MLWPMTAVALGFLGLVALAIPAAGVGLEARRLARRLDDAAQQVSRATRDLERSAAEVAGRAGSTRDLPGTEFER
ncbi:hypothetical protein [Streptomyces phytophilus]|uniref:hypothetical protein n=1 Tax=Streptomyces phytophilus TaxID=722715 RepID=UPI0015F1154C|nr:hypothetical protein [Streptomyces phytophilus]